MAHKLKFGDGSTNFKRTPFSEHSNVEKGPLYSGSPAKQEKWDVAGGETYSEYFDKTIFPGKDKPKVDDFSGRSKMQQEAIKKDPRYGKLSEEELGVEMKRQSKHHKATGKWDAMGEYDAEGKRKEKELIPIESAKMQPLETTVKEPELAKAEIPDDIGVTAGKPEKEGSWLSRGWKKFQAHHDSGEAKKVEAEFKDAAQAIGGKGYRGGSGDKLRAQIAKDEATKKSSQLITENQAKKDAKDKIALQQKSEMHKSTLALNEQQIAASKALEAQRLLKVKTEEEAIAEKNKLAGLVSEDEPFKPKIIKGVA